MTMATARSAWSAAIEKAGHGGVYLFVEHPRGRSLVWFPSASAAMTSAQGRAFSWRWAGAIGSTTTHRGELIQWSNE